MLISLCRNGLADDHFFDTFTSRTCHGRPLPCNASGACVSEDDAARVFAIGDFEYKWVQHPHIGRACMLMLGPSYIWNAAENATAYTQLTFGTSLVSELTAALTSDMSACPGVFLRELAQNLALFRAGDEHHRLRLYIGHDGTMIRLASALGLGRHAPLRWPALGSEIVMEVRTLSSSLNWLCVLISC